MTNKFTQLCVWPGTVVGSDNIAEFEQFLKEEFNVRVKYHTEIKTNPDLDRNNTPIPDTGGRNDLFFYMHSDDIPNFAVKRLQIGIRWWEDVLGNDNGYLYPESFLNDNPPTW